MPVESLPANQRPQSPIVRLSVYRV
ncbi:hypothetical protein CLIM01_04674 [Colletotrichum limetticola]|uniref:Uncharacterized protein n=1 Tax=Colletotrichum limetticola TaxID=1209924 RepID=A0ABQ9Q2B0_9PEZI|nr:hypothetical protein CLIM01_04674 [Colletotrichum limetticola]